MSCLWLNVQLSLILIISVSYESQQLLRLSAKRNLPKKHLRAAPVYGHWHSSLEGSWTGAPCPYNSLTTVAFWRRSVNAPAVGYWPGSQYQAEFPPLERALLSIRKCLVTLSGTCLHWVAGHILPGWLVELRAGFTVEWDPRWQFSQAAFPASLERCGLVNREEASSQVPVWFLYVLWPKFVVSPKLECYCIVLVCS